MFNFELAVMITMIKYHTFPKTKGHQLSATAKRWGENFTTLETDMPSFIHGELG